MRYCANNGCMNGLQPNFGVSAGMNRVRRIIDNEYPIAMAYVPWQHWGETYDAVSGTESAVYRPKLRKGWKPWVIICAA